MYLKALSLLTFVTYVFCDNEEGGALVYTEDLFNENINNLPHFIKFYAPWCGHCKRMAPVWEELGKKFNVDEDQKAVIAKVDCTVETKLCSAQGVKGYPTVKWFSGANTEGEKYSGPRDVAELTSFVQISLNGGGAAADDEDEDDDDDDAEVEAAKNVDGVWVLTTNSFKTHVSEGHHFIKFFAPWCGHCKSMAPTWVELGREQTDSTVKVNEVDCTAHKEVCSEHGVRGYPTIMWFTDGKMIEKYAGGRDKKSFQNYIVKMTSAKPGSDSEDQKVPSGEARKADDKPAQTEGPVAVLTADNFDSSIEKGTTFVKFYAPWCGHCKKLVPTWEELAESFKDNDKVTIAKVDCTVHKDACKSQGVSGYPTLILFKDGEVHTKYSGQRSMSALQDFVKSKVPHDEL